MQAGAFKHRVTFVGEWGTIKDKAGALGGCDEQRRAAKTQEAG